ncbi:HTH-type transcriptional repressor KstR2 [Microbacterium azadirachtae]|uniref:HTH-type transcriptional repressor KstR2 n=1 Tax=Microbacterium azadirachtae TaxID=582680 RepID=A0A0F0KM17_9MICO|nr:HTH-type transcriptional repressor KstR2 [Microbacterium azadirachtae]
MAVVKRGPYAKGTAKREEILSVALEVVAAKGCRKASNREIAERVGLTQAGLMHHFASREELYQEVLRARDIRDHEMFFAPDPTIEGFLAVIAHNAEVPGLVRLYVEFSAEASIPEHPAHAFFLERYAWLRDGLSGVILRAQDAGVIGPAVDVSAAVDLIVAAADGLQLQWLNDHTVDMVARLRRLWDGLVAVSHAA